MVDDKRARDELAWTPEMAIEETVASVDADSL
jgi:hypothetical protein